MQQKECLFQLCKDASMWTLQNGGLIDRETAMSLAGEYQFSISEDRVRYMREQANCVFALTDGHTPEQRSGYSNSMKVMLEMAGYVLELTNATNSKTFTLP